MWGNDGCPIHCLLSNLHLVLEESDFDIQGKCKIKENTGEIKWGMGSVFGDLVYFTDFP